MKLKRVICALLCALTFTAILPAASGQDVAQAKAFDPVNYANADPDKYYVEVDLTNNIVTVYEKGETGKYDTVAMQALCTPGAKATPTPTGAFTLQHRAQALWLLHQVRLLRPVLGTGRGRHLLPLHPLQQAGGGLFHPHLLQRHRQRGLPRLYPHVCRGCALALL